MSRRRSTASGSPLFGQIYRLVKKIPRGRVVNYGLIARLTGTRCSARLVGYALAACPEGKGIPWQRVVNAQGKISLPGEAGELQRLLLESEGVVFERSGRLDWRRFGWPPPKSKNRPPLISPRRRKGKRR